MAEAESRQEAQTGEQEQKGESSSFAREIGLLGALGVGLGTMVGAGIFVLSAEAAAVAGPAAVFSFIIAGLIVLPIAMSISELATAMPQEGGSYHLISQTLGAFPGAIVGPANWLGLIFATAFYLIAFGRFFGEFVPIPEWITMLAAGGFFIFINYRGAKSTGTVQYVIVGVVLLVLLLFVGRGYFDVQPEHHQPFVAEGWLAVLSTIGLIIVSYTGFEKVTTVSEEIKEPSRNLPLAIIGSVVIATLLYGAVLYVLTGLVSYEQLADLENPLAQAGAEFLGGRGRTIMLIGGLLATASSANAAILASSRINFAMGRDKLIPAWFSALHQDHGTPHRAIIVTGALSMALGFTGQTKTLAEVGSALFILSYAILATSLIAMRYRAPEWYQPAFRVPLVPWLPAAGGLASLAAILTMDRFSQMAGLGLAVASVAWYYFWGRQRTEVQGEMERWWAERGGLPSLGHLVSGELAQDEVRVQPAEAKSAAAEQAIMVAVSNAETGQRLLEVARLLAQGQRNTKIVAVRVAKVGGAISLRDAAAHIKREHTEHHEILQQATGRAQPDGPAQPEGRRQPEGDGVPIEHHVQVARTEAAGIVWLAEEWPWLKLILLGWDGPLVPHWPGARIDREVEENAPCEVGVLIDRDFRPPRRILVAVDDNAHARLALRLARDLRQGGAESATALRVVTGEGDDLERERAWAEALLAEEGAASEIQLELIQAGSVAEGIVASQGYDLILLGAAVTRSLREKIFGAVADIVARRAPCSVLLVRHAPGRVPTR
jgi:basic amino acid/polyamine antiporter, APA family